MGVPSVWPARSYYAQLHGAIRSGIRWGAGPFFCSAPAAPSAQGRQPGSSWCWKGGIFQGLRIFAVHFCSAAAPGFGEQSLVLGIRVGWSGSTTDCAGGREFHHCFGAGGAVSSSSGRDACRCTGGGFRKSVTCSWSSYPPAVPFESSGASPPAQLARPRSQVGIVAPRNADEVPVEFKEKYVPCLLYTSPSPRDLSTSRMPSSA